MTKDEVLNVEAGREMDALVAERVMGWSRSRWAPIDSLLPPKDDKKRIEGHTYYVPLFSTDIAAAWEVVEEMNKTYHWRISSPFIPGEPYFAGLTPHGVTGWNGCPDYEMPGDIVSLAICRAALLAKLEG